MIRLTELIMNVVVCIVTLIHGLTPRLGVWLMNVGIRYHVTEIFYSDHCILQALGVFKIVILLFMTVTGDTTYDTENNAQLIVN